MNKQRNEIHENEDLVKSFYLEGDWVLSLNTPTDKGNRKAQKIICDNPAILGAITAYVPELCNKDTPVFQMKKGSLKNVGGLTKILKDSGIHNKIIVPSGILKVAEPLVYLVGDDDIVEDNNDSNAEIIMVGDNDLIIENELNKADDDYDDMGISSDIIPGGLVRMVDNAIDRYSSIDTPEKSKFESSIYENIFKKRDELGLNVDHFTKKNKNGRKIEHSKYRLSKSKDAIGTWISKEYVQEAITALETYDYLIQCNDIGQLTEALDIVGKYFTKEAEQEACGKIVRQVYAINIDKGDKKSLEHATSLAEQYFTGEEKEKALATIDGILKNDYKGTAVVEENQIKPKNRQQRDPKRKQVIYGMDGWKVETNYERKNGKKQVIYERWVEDLPDHQLGELADIELTRNIRRKRYNFTSGNGKVLKFPARELKESKFYGRDKRPRGKRVPKRNVEADAPQYRAA